MQRTKQFLCMAAIRSGHAIWQLYEGKFRIAEKNRIAMTGSRRKNAAIYQKQRITVYRAQSVRSSDL